MLNKCLAWLGYPHEAIVRNVISENHLPISISKLDNCRACLIGKSCRINLPQTFSKSYVPLELLHSDVWGPSPIESLDGFRYFVIFIDDFFRFIWLYPMRQKSEVGNIFKEFHVLVERQISHKIKSFQSDFRGEYQALSSYFKSIGIKHRISCPHTMKKMGPSSGKFDTLSTLV